MPALDDAPPPAPTRAPDVAETARPASPVVRLIDPGARPTPPATGRHAADAPAVEDRP